MPAINDPNWIAPGKICYQVYGSIIPKKATKIDIDLYITKYIITTKPQNLHYNYGYRTSSLFFGTISAKSGDKTGFSIHDCGMNNKINYNLNRIFATIEEAREFVSECFLGKFFDTADQLIYNDHNPVYINAPYIPIMHISHTSVQFIKHRGTI